MRFDTRNKKPKLYFLIPITAAAALIVFLLARSDAQANSLPIVGVMLAYLVVVLVSLVWAFIGQLKYNPYSYNTIYYAGFALFVLSLIVTHSVVLMQLLFSSAEYSVSALMGLLLDSAKQYMLVSAPFIVAFSVALTVSNISLLLHERKRFVNVLGILLAVLLVAGELFLFFCARNVSGSQKQVMLHEFLFNLFAAVYLYFECMLIGTIIANLIVVRYETEPDKDYLIVLGCGLRADGTPTPLLKTRLDRALKFYNEQKAKTGRELSFITSGGQGANEVNSESLAMTRYLIENGVAEDRIISEDRSKDTAENMRFSKQKIAERCEGGEFDGSLKIAFTTNNYHVFRSGLMARRVKMRAIGVGATTKWYFWPNAAVREFVGLLSAHRLKQTIIFTSMIAFYAILTWLVYR